MNPAGVHRQLQELIERLVETSISVKQFFPALRNAGGGTVTVGGAASSSIALRNVDYALVYREIDANDAYDVKLVDGGLLIFQYCFDRAGTLLKHRLAYFPCPTLPSVDECPALYEDDALFGDIVAKNLVRFPIRFDYAPKDHCDVTHPASHLSLGQYENCRIPVTGPISPSTFGLFIVRNFYCRAYKRNKNRLDKRGAALPRVETISDAERRILHVAYR